MSENRIQEYIEIALENEDFLNYDIDIHGKTSKGDGYLGNIFFVTVTGKTKNNVKKTIDLVVKASQESNALRKQIPASEVFKKEIYIYSKVKTVFEKFQKDKGAENLLNFLPHCYACGVKENREFLIFENLRLQGFDLWDRITPMTYDHVKLVLQAYGKMHAFSLALKTENPEIFKNLTQNSVNMFSHFIFKTKMIPIIHKQFVEAKNSVALTDDTGLIKKLEFSENDVEYIFGDMLNQDSVHHVITHGDCWNNNFLFKYQEGIKNPSSVRILDWQCSGLSSPVIDLSHFIYACCDTGENKDIAELLKVYHNSLDDCLKQLDCKSDEIFSYNDLVEHWKKFSCYGFIISPLILNFCFGDTDETPDFAETAERGKEFLDNFNFIIKNNKEDYFQRLKNNFLHYIHNLN